MRRLVSSQSALAADRQAETSFGYPPELMMEEAGIRLQDRLESLEAGRWAAETAYLVGPGNNGGDGWVMARQAFLRGRAGVVVVEVLAPGSASCRLQATRAVSVGVPRVSWPSELANACLRSASVWVDALWGTGLQGPLRTTSAEVVAQLDALRAESGKPVVAIDVPSGLWDKRQTQEPVLQATYTLSPGPIKDFCFFPGHRSLCGQLFEVPLAFPRPAQAVARLVEEPDLPTLVPPIASQSHKGTRGHVALLGGAEGMTGALVLAARSAAAAGAGLITLGVDSELTSLVAPQVPAFQVRPVHTCDDLAPRFHALVVGPGWGRDESRSSLLAAWWNTTKPLVIDADGLVAWVGLGRPSRQAPTVFTPHPGEYLRLGVGEATVESAAALAVDRNVVVVLKGSVTWILGPDGRRSVWDGAEPALGTGGSGDCLAGVVGALLAAGLGAFEAAEAAVALHGLAGRTLAREEGWFTADRLPAALAKVASACRTASGRL